MTDGVLGEPITIRFDGLDADHHEIELSVLAESLSGLSQIISASAHFAMTGAAATRKDLQRVRVFARPPRDGCFIVDAVVNFAREHPIIKDYAVQVVAPLTVGVVTWIFTSAAGKKEEMKLLQTSLDTAIRQLGEQNQQTVTQLVNTIEVMADRLRPAARKAVAPLGRSARTLSVTAGVEKGVQLDEADRDAILSKANITVDDERTYQVLISELDMQTGACLVEIEGDEPTGRHPARITDPVFSLPNNAYVTAMAAKVSLTVRAKATYQEGRIERLYISNYSGRPRGEPDFQLR